MNLIQWENLVVNAIQEECIGDGVIRVTEVGGIGDYPVGLVYQQLLILATLSGETVPLIYIILNLIFIVIKIITDQ